MSETVRTRPSALSACPSFVAAMDIVGRRWNGLIVQALAEGCTSFSEIARYAERLSDAVLARRLRELEDDGLVERTIVDARPPAVRYTLTGAGAALAPILDSLTEWGERFTPPEDDPQDVRAHGGTEQEA
ncbi:helix-turn-helix domain-containing protein [Microbacterium betulae]|uniref:Helix-turn-helix domain-containing protein n=1 Tax=Microbacterium betulae TaxID=2981139 RepID=A0AA97I7B4_9MICO|nr:helix-turn-helix domain-containing protein [Microbacterium sp. AB]WOF24072.1 helix-turn-helix domain-containing protein [Microbacterium sp. AB]